MSGRVLRVLFDTNIFVSYLLSSSRHRTGTIAVIVEAAFAGAFELLVPEDLLAELHDVLTTRPYFTERIGAEQVQAFIASVRAVATVLPAIPEPVPRVVRDPKDDYLLARALLGGADYLVTGDDDLLSLGAAGQTTIVSPRIFLERVAAE
jgi:uncharacterized protein